MPAPHMTGPTIRPFAAPTEKHVCPTQSMISITPLGPTVLNAREAKRRSWQATRRYARIIARPRAVGSPRPPLQRLLRKASFRSSPPPRPARLGSTIPLGRYASPRLKPASSSPRVGPLAPVAPPVLQITAADNDASAAAEPILNTLLSYSHCDWEQAAPSRRQPFTNLSL